MAATVTIQSGATWQEVAADRQKHRDATLAIVEPPLPDTLPDIPLHTIPIAKAILSVEEIQITESTVEDLVPGLAKGEISSVKVVAAFLRRAVLAQKATNCITEVLSPQALERAKYLDEYLAKNGKPAGPLHGIPISVKEHVGMKDLDHNAGFVGWVGALAPADAHILQILWKAGAVFYARTTQPQCLMHLETSSNLYGVTTNPFNTTLTPGGSSGGEGALVGFRGSCLGIGTDIGGSIRSPAGNCGVYGMKPTSGRLPIGGLKACGAGEEQIVPSIGPLSTSLEGCKLFIKTIIDSKPWYREPSLLPFPWKEEEFFKSKRLKIAVLWDDGVVKPQPPVTRALKQVVEKLKAKSNVEVVEWKPYKHDLAWEIIANLYFCDGGAEQSAAIATSNEQWLPLSDHILKNKYVENHSIASLYQATIRREVYRMEYANLWNSTATSTGPNGEPEGMVDVILGPVGPGCAPKIGTAKWWGYTSQWNLLDYPGLVFPVDKVDTSKDAAKETHTPRNELDKENWDFWEQNGAEGYKDAPLSLQLIGRRYEDEKIVQALEIIQQETGLPFVTYT
ncbi:amidase signature domain-containing protein [Amylocarpus encephaloides]|uniref:amidase n=1 Tax=Amylocarpus encephaloides TaxID=45428 RepID=A0A9P7YQN1_9HELO|nr:amidase signature domain-containing protein [Amylocarpus encephaloides]